MPDRKKLLGAAAITASLLGGGVAGALLGAPMISSAQEQSTTTVPDDQADTANPGADPRHRDGRHAGCGLRRIDLGVAAEAIGIPEDELRGSLGEGGSLADVASERDVDPQVVIDALVSAATTEIGQAVADGEIDAERATAIKEDLAERVDDFVNRDVPLHDGGRGPGRGGRRF